MPEMNPREPTWPRKWKRTAAAAMLPLVGGAVVNVAVAWGYATHSNTDLHLITREPTKDDDLWWSRDVGERSPDPIGAVMVHADRSCSVRIGVSNKGGRLRVVDGAITLEFPPLQRQWQEWTQTGSLRFDPSLLQGELQEWTQTGSLRFDPSLLQGEWEERAQTKSLRTDPSLLQGELQELADTTPRLSRPGQVRAAIEVQDDEKVVVEDEETPALANHVNAIEATVGVPMRTGSLLFIREWQPLPADPALQVSGSIGFQISKVSAASRRSAVSWDLFHKARVFWLGFALNTIFYALVLCALWWLSTTPFMVRRALRRRRGLCEKCAYPIGVSAVCTECGAAVSRHEPRARQNEPRA